MFCRLGLWQVAAQWCQWLGYVHSLSWLHVDRVTAQTTELLCFRPDVGWTGHLLWEQRCTSDWGRAWAAMLGSAQRTCFTVGAPVSQHSCKAVHEYLSSTPASMCVHQQARSSLSRPCVTSVHRASHRYVCVWGCGLGCALAVCTVLRM